MLALVSFVDHLQNNKFLIRSYHAALTWFNNSKNNSKLLQRWSAILDSFDYELMTKLDEYTYEVRYRPKEKHANADSLSRYPYVCNVVTDFNNNELSNT